MSTQLDLYMQYNGHTPHDITNRNVFDGFDFGNQDILPAFTWSISKNEWIDAIAHKDLPAKSITADQLARTLADVYHQLSEDVTGEQNGLGIYQINLNDLINFYNDYVVGQETDYDNYGLQQLVADLLRRIFNAYYFQLNVTGDPAKLNPDGQHEINTAGLYNNIYLVGWLDA